MSTGKLVDLFDHVRRRKLRENTNVLLSCGYLRVEDNRLVHTEIIDNLLGDPHAFGLEESFLSNVREALTIAKIANLPVEFHTPRFVREASEAIAYVRRTEQNPDETIKQYNVLEAVDAFQRLHGIEQLQATYMIEPGNTAQFDAWVGTPEIAVPHDHSVIALGAGQAKLYAGHSTYTPYKEGGAAEYRAALTEAMFVAQLTDRPVDMSLDKFTLRQPEMLKPYLNRDGTLRIPPMPEPSTDSYYQFQSDAYSAPNPTFGEMFENIRKYRQNQGLEPKDP